MRVLRAALAAAAKGAVHSVKAAPPGAGDAVCHAEAAQLGGAPPNAAPARAAPAGAAPAGAAPPGAAPPGAARAGATPAGGPAVCEEAAPAQRASYAVYMCLHTHKSHDPRRVPSHSLFFTPKQLRSKFNCQNTDNPVKTIPETKLKSFYSPKSEALANRGLQSCQSLRKRPQSDRHRQTSLYLD